MNSLLIEKITKLFCKRSTYCSLCRQLKSFKPNFLGTMSLPCNFESNINQQIHCFLRANYLNQETTKYVEHDKRLFLKAQRGWSSSFSTSVSNFPVLIEVCLKSEYRSGKVLTIYLSDFSILSLKIQELKQITFSKLLWCNNVTKKLVGVNNHKVSTTK